MPLSSLASPALLENRDNWQGKLRLSSLHFQKYVITIGHISRQLDFPVIYIEIVLLLVSNTNLNESDKSKPGKTSLLLPAFTEDYY